MTMVEQNPNVDRAFQLHSEGYTLPMIESILRNEGLPDTAIMEALCRIKLLRYRKRKSRGVFMMVIGGVLLITGFIATVLLFHADRNFDLFMYGFTSVGIILMGLGAYEVLQ